ncbi:MAG: arsenate reductase/protein-tyrosine-phosphatase family protein [Halothiobacillus sp.]
MNLHDLHQNPELLFSALSDETRLRILMLLESEPCLCVCHVQMLLNKPQSTVSRHIGVLMDDNWLALTRKGTSNLYALSPNMPMWVREILRLSRMSWSLSVNGYQLLQQAHEIYLNNHDLLSDASAQIEAPSAETQPDKVFHVLFLCVANSARSILAEALLNRWGQGRFKAYSAGQSAAASVHPMTFEALRRFDLPTAHIHAKHWSVFLTPDAPKMDLVITVCDTLLNEACPAWPGRPITAHWGVSDPVRQMAAHPDQDPVSVFIEAGRTLETRVRLLTQLSDYAIEKIRIRDEISAMGLMSE